MLRFSFPAANRYCDPAMIACSMVYSSFGVLGRFQDQGEERQVKGEEKQRNIDYAREAATTPVTVVFSVTYGQGCLGGQ